MSTPAWAASADAFSSSLQNNVAVTTAQQIQFPDTGQLTGLCGNLLGGSPFTSGLLGLGTGTGGSGLAGLLVGGMQSLIDTLCSLVMGTTSTGTTPATVKTQAQNVSDALNANSIVSGVKAAGGSSGNQVIDGINGATSLLAGFGIHTLEDLLSFVSGILSSIGVAISDIESLLSGLAHGLEGIFTDPVHILDNIEADVGRFLGVIPGTHIAGQVRPKTAPVIAAAHIADINPELLWDPGFDSAGTVSAMAPWITWDGTTGHTAAGSLLIQPDGAYVYSQVSNPIPITDDHELAVSIWCKWSGITYTGTTPIQLHVLEFSAGVRQDSIQVAEFTSPPTNQATWQQLSLSGYVPSSGSIDTVYLRPLVDVSCTAGSIWFDDGSVTKINALPSSVLANIPPDVVLGIQGISDIGTTNQNLWDNMSNVLASALGLSGVLSSGNTLSTVTGTVQSAGQVAGTAATQAAANTNTLAIQNNRSTASGLEATVESNMSLSSLGTGSTPSTISVTQAVSGGTFLRISQSKTLGFMQWWGSSSGSITGFYYNFYRMDSSGNLNLLFSSTDQHALLSGTGGWYVYTFSGANEIAVLPGDVIAAELQVVGAGTVTVAGLGQTWQTNHPSANTVRSGFTHNWGTSAASTISAGSVTYTGATPYVGIGVSNLPAGYEPPETMLYITPGTYTFTIPSWMVTGNKIDLIVLGAGGGGAQGALHGGAGGDPGSWSTTTYNYGTDIPLTTTTLTVTVGDGGDAGVYKGASASAGTASSVSGTGMTTVTGAGGAAAMIGGPGGAPSPATETVNGTIYHAGTGSSNAPGSGGNGGPSYGSGAPGADGSVWIVARQS